MNSRLFGGAGVPLESQGWLKWSERIHPAAVIFVILCLNRIAVKLNGGEEHYLAFALQHYNPDWIPGSFTYSEFPGTRLLFQTITGFFVDRFGFYPTALAGRVAVFALISFPLARIFRHFRFPVYAVIIIVQLFLFDKQSFFADEWIFWGFEPKAPAYIFLFWGLLFFLERRYMLMAVALAISSWFHLLVGGWFFAGVMAVMVLTKVKFRDLFFAGAVFLVMTAPLIIYLWPLLSFGTDGPVDTNLNHIYVYFRLKHHLGLFDSYGYFIEKHLVGVVSAFLILLTQFLLLKKTKNSSVRRITILNTVFLSIALIFVVISWIDMEFFGKSGRFGLKYYPFRMMSISLMISLIQAVWLIIFRIRNIFWKYRILVFLAASAVIILGVRVCLRITDISKDLRPDPYVEELVSEVKKASAPGDVFIILSPDYPTATAFGRLTRRENFVVFKYVPAESAKLAEWYRRLQVERLMAKNPDLIYKTAVEENIKFVLAREQVDDPGLRLVWPSALYYLYEVLPQQCE